jgi:hypothetical protein
MGGSSWCLLHKWRRRHNDETRMTNVERRPNDEIRKTADLRVFCFSLLGFVSSFDIRHSDSRREAT